MDALGIVRDGTRVRWRKEVIKQVDGCSLGPAVSCDYCDISLDSFLQVLVPRLEQTLKVDLKWLKFYRDDGILIFFGDSNIVLDILKILNGERQELQFTTEFCECKNVLGCCSSCPKSLPYLDCTISVYQLELENGVKVPQLKTTTYSKATDIHHYIEPKSCTPNLSNKSPAIIKGVAHRLRLTTMLDSDLLDVLNTYGGYLVASGYDRSCIIQSFTNILSVTNREIAFRNKVPDTEFKVALVTKHHPALPHLSQIIDEFYPIINNCPVSSTIFPKKSLISATRKLPTLSTILTANPFYSPSSPASPRGFHKTPGCSCNLCKEGYFTPVIFSNNQPGRGFSLPRPTNCKAINTVYVISCPCGLQYVGRTGEPVPRWTNHKSHVRCRRKTCNLANHCIQHHPDMDLSSSPNIKESLKFTILESCSPDQLVELEESWRNRLQTWAPLGLNIREDGPDRLRRKAVMINAK